MKKVTKNITVEQIELNEQEVQAVRTVMHLIPQLKEEYCEQFEDDCQGCPLADPYGDCSANRIVMSMEYILGYDAVRKGTN